jgi:iron-sulfur cluster assembly protein
MGDVISTPTTSTAPIALTEHAAIELAKIRSSQPEIPADYALRVGVKGGGCSGFDEVKPNDNVFESNGVRIAMEKSHAIYLLGMEVDFVQGLENRGFTFSNPNATSTCGCGTSFAA